MINIGNTLKEHRLAYGITQSALAKATDIKQQNISRWESNTHNPDILDCIKLANFYEISIEELLGLEENFGTSINKNLIERPPYEITDKQTLDILKLCKVMTEIQKAQVFGYVVGLLEQAGVNVQQILSN